jgi:glycosyltransferase involved in cell wall biosynthesis
MLTDPRPPLLSLIVPVYGVEDYVGDCLDSILSASDFAAHCELIIVDDGSLDRSMDIAEERCSNLVNVRIVRQPNAGLGAARNTGLSHARGRYVWFIDSDDEISSDAITVLAESIERASPDVIAFEFETLGGTLDRASYLAVYDHPVNPVEFLSSGRPPSPVQFYAFSRQALARADLSFHAGIYHEDALFTALALTRLCSLVRIRAACYRYRLREGSIMSMSRPEKHLADMLRIAELLSEEALEYPSDSPVRRALGREVGFALSAARYYAARTAPDSRRTIAPTLRLFTLGRHWWPYFPGRVLLNYIRLIGLAALSQGRLRV